MAETNNLKSPSKIKLDIATASDAVALTELVNSAYRGDSSRAGWTTEADLLDGQRTDPEALTAMMQPQGSPEQVILVLKNEDRSKPLASVYLKRQGAKAYLGMLTVSPQLQAGGMGRQVLAAVEEWAQTYWQSTCMEMTVIDSRIELISWYERRGYKKTARREPFPYGNPRFGVPKVSNLEFIVLEKNLLEPSAQS